MYINLTEHCKTYSVKVLVLGVALAQSKKPKIKGFKEAMDAYYNPLTLSIDLPWARSNYALELITKMRSCKGNFCAIHIFK